MAGPFGWCGPENRHDKCIQEYTRFTVDPKTSKVIHSDVVVRCECTKRTCDCYVKRADRTKKTTRRRKT